MKLSLVAALACSVLMIGCTTILPKGTPERTTTDTPTNMSIGDRSCAEWIDNWAERKSFDANWIIGFMTGLSTASSKEFLNDIDDNSIMLWIDNYCRNNPLDSLSSGGLMMREELIKRMH